MPGREDDDVDQNDWTPSNPVHWQRIFGFVPQSLGGGAPEVTVLRDGTAGSFALKESAGSSDRISTETMSQVWSADVRHLVCTDNERMTVWRWDNPQRGEVSEAPKNLKDGRELIEGFARVGRPRVPDVRQHVLQAFRQIRLLVHDPAAAVVLLHGVLTAIQQDHQHTTRFLASELYKLFSQDGLQELVGGLIDSSGDADLSDVAHYLMQRSAVGLRLHADILLAHVSSRLFQEAHLDLERQGFFLGMAPEPSGKPKSSEIRYTPVNLARLLVQKTLTAREGSNSALLLDPACGSGVFLLEAVNEIAQNHVGLSVSLKGVDVSVPAVAIARTSVREAASALKNADVEIQLTNALDNTWPAADVVVMNPPFRAWKDMDDDDRKRVEKATGNKKRPDKSLAFLQKAWDVLQTGGVLASVLPAPLLLSDGMRTLQKTIEAEGEVLLIGRLEGYTYFTNAIVETAFIVVRKSAPSPQSLTTIALGKRNHEDAAIRQLRVNAPEQSTNVAEIYSVAQNLLPETGWLPRPRRLVALLDWARRTELPRVSDTFDVHQGVRTGLKAAFVLSAQELHAMPKREQRFFRPAAGQGSINAGVLTRPLYVFYPYSGAGATLESEDTLQDKVPKYYERLLDPQRNRLASRKKIREWWLPTWPRNWQHEHERKIVSTYFGLRGSFAVDTEGDHVVVDGFGWLLKKVHDPSADALVSYLPILNSATFEDLVAAVSWRLQGGQLRLEPKYIKSLPMPRVAELPPSLQKKCRELGKRIASEGIDEVSSEIESLVRDCYAMPEQIT